MLNDNGKNPSSNKHERINYQLNEQTHFRSELIDAKQPLSLSRELLSRIFIGLGIAVVLMNIYFSQSGQIPLY